MDTFNDTRHLPEPLREHFLQLEIFIGDMDGLDTTTGDVVDTSDVVKAFNGVLCEIERLRAELEASRKGVADMVTALREIADAVAPNYGGTIGAMRKRALAALPSGVPA